MPLDQQTFDFLKGEWYAAGGPQDKADVAAAIAFAESSGCQYALAGPVDIRPVKECHWTVTNGENSCGYWQINLRAHPQYSAPAIFDPVTNAAAAVAISNHGADFGPWTTYTKGYYKQYLDQFGGHPVTPPPPPPQPAQTSPLNSPAGQGSSVAWNRLTNTLGRELPRQLAASSAYRRAALRQLTLRRKVR